MWMSNRYNLSHFEAPFKIYLSTGNAPLSKISIKNYLSDLRHFLSWLKFRTKNQLATIEALQSRLKTSVISEYRAYMQSSRAPIKTTNRRLSTVRKFGNFCIEAGWLSENPGMNISNISPLKSSEALGVFTKDERRVINELLAFT